LLWWHVIFIDRNRTLLLDLKHLNPNARRSGSFTMHPVVQGLKRKKDHIIFIRVHSFRRLVTIMGEWTKIQIDTVKRTFRKHTLAVCSLYAPPRIGIQKVKIRIWVITCLQHRRCLYVNVCEKICLFDVLVYIIHNKWVCLCIKLYYRYIWYFRYILNRYILANF